MRDRRSLRHTILIILGAAVVYLIGNSSVSLWDRDEPRYAQTSRQMLLSGDWVVPRLLDEVRTAKPIFIYWCQAGAMKLLEDNAFAARLPSVVGMILTLILLAIIIHRTIGPRRAWLTVLILATSGLAIASAKICLTDAVLLLFVTAAQIGLCSVYMRARRRPVVIVTWIAIGLAVLTKGPVVIGVQLTTMLVLAIMDWKTTGIGWWRGTRPLMGILIVAIICGPWLYLVHQREPGFLPTIIGHDVLNRMTTGLEGHKGPPGYYLLTIWVTYFPWSLLLPAAIVSAWKNRRLPQIRFALAAVIGPWVMFELIQTKLPHYLLPTFPALAFLTADMLIRAARKRQFADRIFLRIVLTWGVIVAMIGLLPWLAMWVFGAPPRAAFYAMIVLPILGFEYARSIYIHFRAARPVDAAAVMGIGMMILVAIFYGIYLPNAPYLQISSKMANLLKQEGATHPGDVMMIDYKETSLAFYQGGTIRPQRDNLFLEHVPPEEWPRWIVITDEIWAKMPPVVKDRLEVLDSVRGWSYADSGRRLEVLLLRKK